MKRPSKKPPDPDPELVSELYEALDALEVTARELRAARRALFPSIQANRRAVKRIREIWRTIRGGKTEEPSAPLLDAIHARNGHGGGNGLVHITEELPDGGKPLPRRQKRSDRPIGLKSSTVVVAAPATGWDPSTMLVAARQILGPEAELDWDQLQELVVCRRAKCGAMRRLPMEARMPGPKCPACGSKEWVVYSVAAGEIERREEQMKAPEPKRRRKAVPT